MGLLSKEQILAINDRNYKSVLVPEWGGSVRVRSMNAFERIEFEKRRTELPAQFGDAADSRMLVELLVRTLVDHEDHLLFELEEAELLQQKSPSVLVRLVEIALELNGLDTESGEELRGNLSTEKENVVSLIDSHSDSDTQMSM